jgi:hypothetical protein
LVNSLFSYSCGFVSGWAGVNRETVIFGRRSRSLERLLTVTVTMRIIHRMQRRYILHLVSRLHIDLARHASAGCPR